jgi:hypothetical protein
MSKYSIKFAQDDRYFSDDYFYITTEQMHLLELLRDGKVDKEHCTTSSLANHEKQCIDKFIALVKTHFSFDANIKSTQYYNSAVVGGYYFHIPFKKVMETADVNYHGKSLEQTLAAGAFAKDTLQKMATNIYKVINRAVSSNNKKSNGYYGNQANAYLKNPLPYFNFLKEQINFSVPRNFPKTTDEAIIIEDDEFTQYVERTAYAIFMKASREDATQGYFGASVGMKKLGTDLANARTFNSPKLAEKCAKSNHYYIGDNYAIVEVSMRMKQVVSYKNPIEKLDAALAIIEKERIEKFFEENSLEVIEQKLNELKAKQAQIQDEKAQAKQDFNESTQIVRKRNKI